MKKLLNVFVVAAALIIPTQAHAGYDTYLGEIMTFAGNFCPRGYEVADGRLLPISQNTALFSLLGTLYGGDGMTTFALPNIKPVLTVNRAALMSCIAVEGVFPSRN